VERIVVSSRVNRKLNGPLHKDTVFSKPKTKHERKSRLSGPPSAVSEIVHHVRVPLARLKAKDIQDNIVDPVVQRAIAAQLERLGDTPDKAFQDPNNHPYLMAKDGRLIPIHRVRIRKSDKPMAVGKGSNQRYVNPGSNHHMEVVAILDAEGNETRWEGQTVSRFEAVQRKRRGEAIVKRDHGANRRFKFSISASEHLMMHKGSQGECLYRVENISGSNLELILHTDARPSTLRKSIPSARVRASASTLRGLQARKVTVCPLGEILPAND
jgi:CRISPR-associated endonuclease Csn1